MDAITFLLIGISILDIPKDPLPTSVLVLLMEQIVPSQEHDAPKEVC